MKDNNPDMAIANLTVTDEAAVLTGRTVSLWSSVRTGARRVRQVFHQEIHRRPGESVRAYRRRMMLFFGPLMLPAIFYSAVCAAFVIGSGEAGLRHFSILLSANWLYVIPPAGKESIIPLLIQSGIHPALAAVSLVFLDSVVAFFFACNFSYVQRLPIADRFVEVFMRQGQRLLRERPWIRNFSFLSVMFFVMIPFYGSGSIGGTLMGMVLGLGSLVTWLAILCGTVVGSFSLAYGASRAKAFLAQLSYGGYITSTFFLGMILYYIYKSRGS